MKIILRFYYRCLVVSFLMTPKMLNRKIHTMIDVRKYVVDVYILITKLKL